MLLLFLQEVATKELGFFEKLSIFLQQFALSVVTVWSFAFFAFWGVIVLFCLYHVSFNDRYWTTGVLFGLAFVLLFIAGAVSPLTYAAENPWWAVIYVGGYLLIATGWMTFRWMRFIEKVRSRRGEAIRSYLKDKFSHVKKEYLGETDTSRPGVDEVEVGSREQKVQAWYDHLVANGYALEYPNMLTQNLNRHAFDSSGLDIGNATEAPRFRNHKRDYFSYFFYWPLDMVIYVLGELIRDIWKAVVRLVQDAFDNYSAKRTKQKINL